MLVRNVYKAYQTQQGHFGLIGAILWKWPYNSDTSAPIALQDKIWYYWREASTGGNLISDTLGISIGLLNAPIMLIILVITDTFDITTNK